MDKPKPASLDISMLNDDPTTATMAHAMVSVYKLMKGRLMHYEKALTAQDIKDWEEVFDTVKFEIFPKKIAPQYLKLKTQLGDSADDLPKDGDAEIAARNVINLCIQEFNTRKKKDSPIVGLLQQLYMVI